MTKLSQESLDKLASDKAKCLNERGIRCYLCNGNDEQRSFGIRERAATKDHVVPKSDPNFLQGSQRGPRKNIRWAHHGCNAKKANMPITFFRMLVLFERFIGG